MVRLDIRTDTFGAFFDLPILYVLLVVLRRFLDGDGLYRSDIFSLSDIHLNIFILPRSMFGEGISDGGCSAGFGKATVG